MQDQNGLDPLERMAITKIDNEGRKLNPAQERALTILLSQNSKNKAEKRRRELSGTIQKKDPLHNSEVIERLWTNAHVPAKFFPEYAKDKLEMDLGEKSRRWNEEKNKIKTKFQSGFLIGLLGEWGTGKTQMAGCLIQDACSRQMTSLYVKTREFFFRIREAYKKDGPTELTALKEFIDPAFLVMDEIGERGETPWEDRTLIYLIDKRYEEMKDTLLVSNQDEKEFFISVGLSIKSRMSETGGIIECAWESFR